MSQFQSFRFAVLNDLHYTDAEDGPWLEALVAQINRTGAGGGEGGEQVELCLVLGDLAEMGTQEELSAAREILRKLNMPWYVVPGNHDGPPGRDMNTPTGGLEMYERLYPGRRNYMFEHKGWQFVALDSTDGSGWQHVNARPETLAFARQAAGQLDRNRPTVVFTHFPVGTGVPYALDNGAELLAIFRGQRIPVIFSGHFHGQTRVEHEGMELVTNRCCSMRREIHDGQTSRGYFLCRATAEGKVEREFVEFRGKTA